jgi:hypothetical protein
MKKLSPFVLFLIFSSSPVSGEVFDIIEGDYVCHEIKSSKFTYDKNNIEKIEVKLERLEETESERAKREKEIIKVKKCALDPQCWAEKHIPPWRWSGPFEISYKLFPEDNHWFASYDVPGNKRFNTVFTNPPGDSIYADAEDEQITISFGYSFEDQEGSLWFFTGGHGVPGYYGHGFFEGSCTKQLQE